MNKTKILPLLGFSLLMGCSSNNISSSSTTTIEPTIKANEVEAGSLVLETKTLDVSGYYLLDDDNPSFTQITFDQSLRLFTENGTGIVFYSYPNCPYCNRAIPVLNEVAKDEGVNVFYVYIYEDEMIVDKTEEEWNDTLDKFYEVAGSTLPQQLNEETGEEEPVFYVPLVIALKNGQITDSHVRLVSGFMINSEDDEETNLTTEQHDELYNIYKEVIESIK